MTNIIKRAWEDRRFKHEGNGNYKWGMPRWFGMRAKANEEYFLLEFYLLGMTIPIINRVVNAPKYIWWSHEEGKMVGKTKQEWKDYNAAI